MTPLTDADVRRVIRGRPGLEARRRAAAELEPVRLPELATPAEIRRAMGVSLQVGGLDDG